MLLVPVFVVVFTISLCSANSFECHYYTDSSKTLEIYCNNYRNQLPKNCTRESTSVNPLEVTHLKIKECEQSFIGDASEKYPNIQSLNISQSGYRALDWSGKTFENVVLLDASDNELTDIPTSILRKFPQLYELRLDRNKIEKISSGDFGNFNRDLGTISLSSNGLKFIGDFAFANFANLVLINISNNEFSTFPMEVFRATNRSVFLQENPQLTTIDCELIRAMGSNRIYFTWEYITAFDGRCAEYWKFSVENWEFDELIHNSAEHSTLYCKTSEECFAHMQYFVAGPGSFENVGDMLNLLDPSALKIDLTGNRIDEVNATTFHRFANLSELNLSNTGLKKFSFEFLNNQTQLKYLDLSQNHLDAISSLEHLKNLKQLTYFDAARNQIRNINDIVKNLPISIQHLILNENWPAQFDLRSFGRLQNLTELNLSGNWIIPNSDNEIDIGQLPNSLQRLDLHGTSLEKIKDLDRQHFPLLKTLDISNNLDLDCDHSDKLHSEFKDADAFKRDECKQSSKFWVILLACVAILVIITIIIIEKVRRK